MKTVERNNEKTVDRAMRKWGEFAENDINDQQRNNGGILH